jgi:hypothetical protein
MASEPVESKQTITGGATISVAVAVPAAVVLVGVALTLGFLAGRWDAKRHIPVPTVVDAQSRKLMYGFEAGSEGWAARAVAGSRAFKQAKASTEQAKQDKASLRLDTELAADDIEKSQGEAFVKLPTPVDLMGKKITAAVFAGAGAAGDDAKPNGFQLFAKDERSQSVYGAWHNVREEEWMELELLLAGTEPTGGYMDSEFDPHQVVEVGIKMGTGQGSGSTFTGPVYVDEVVW